MKRRLAVSQGTVLRLLQAAERALRERDLAQATEQTERAQRLDPADVGILLFLGQIHGRNHEPAKAEQMYDRAARLSPKPVETLLECGKRASNCGHFELGCKYFEQAATHKNTTPEALAALAGALERLRKIDEALVMTGRALEKNAACGEALLVRARLLRQRGELATAETHLRTPIPSDDKMMRVKIGYELANILDRQGRYDEAMTTLLETKTLLQADAKQHAYELQVTRNRLKELREGMTDEVCRRWLDAAKDMEPARRVALLGGHPRSGTTLLEQVVDTHPEAISAEETELFHDDAYVPLTRGQPEDAKMQAILEGAPTERLQQSRKNYFERATKFLRQPIGGRLLIDKNPSVTFLIPAFLRIFPEAKFLIALRDPRDVCMSCFMQPVSLNQASSAWLSLDGTIREYGDLMSMWLALRPQLTSQALEVRYEDMVEDLEAVARRTLDFLELPWDERVLGFDEHARQKMVRSPTYADVTKKVFKTAVGRWRHYEKYFAPHLETLDPIARALGYE